jgi:NAD(P)-dependent dehydrogenase (short-subunit alcohol dehydrogenase family)
MTMGSMTSKTALVTGGSRGFGLALATSLVDDGWTVIADARNQRDLTAATRSVPGLVGVAGGVEDAEHRQALAEVVAAHGPLQLLVNNASSLGPSPLPPLLDLSTDELSTLLTVNVVAPLALLQQLAPMLARDAVVVDVSSDAAVEAYPGWGGYGASKAALDHLTRVLAVERPDLHLYAFDPGDMRTAMHQAAFPGEDISDRPLPETVAVPALLRLLAERPESGRYRAEELAKTVTA